jgi:effector-binding domain-containing protein
MEHLEALGEYPTGEPFAAYFNMDMQDLDIEAGFPVAKPLPGKGEIQPGEIPGGMAAICHYTGPYSGVAPAYEQLSQFLTDEGFTPIGPAYEWYLSEPDVPPQDIKTDIAFPVKPL